MIVERRITDRDCQSCGACCGTARTPASSANRAKLGLPTTDTWVNCTDADVKRMPRRVRLKLLTVRIDDKQMKATPLREDGTCVFLKGTIADKVSCGIYDVRPSVCRAFKAGSEFCLQSRREIGLPT